MRELLIDLGRQTERLRSLPEGDSVPSRLPVSLRRQSPLRVEYTVNAISVTLDAIRVFRQMTPQLFF